MKLMIYIFILYLKKTIGKTLGSCMDFNRENIEK